MVNRRCFLANLAALAAPVAVRRPGSVPSAEALVREEMIAGMGQLLDLQFQDPGQVLIGAEKVGHLIVKLEQSFGKAAVAARQFERDFVETVSRCQH